ncbi:MAG: UMP kinase [Candidatus Methylarchaceae archaeon HK02M2]|nr:UMP kinase [Candidatus Methylarchaceae archaeon HK02M2]
MKIVLKIGGSIIGSPPDPSILNAYIKHFLELREDGHILAIVIGGGPLSRQFIKTAESLGLNEEDQDELAISISRLNAKLFVKKLKGILSDTIPSTIDQITHLLKMSNIAIMGGLKPGITTDSVAALVAKAIKADLFVKATDQEGVYIKDPRIYPQAKKLDSITFTELCKISDIEYKPGIHSILDLKAIKILKNSGIKTIILNGLKPENVKLAVLGKKIGTRIEV